MFKSLNGFCKRTQLVDTFWPLRTGFGLFSCKSAINGAFVQTKRVPFCSKSISSPDEKEKYKNKKSTYHITKSQQQEEISEISEIEKKQRDLLTKDNSISYTCEGCGVIMQTTDSNQIGYISSEKIVEHKQNILNSVKSKKFIEDKLNLINSVISDPNCIEEDKYIDKRDFKTLMNEAKKSNKKLICERCCKLNANQNLDIDSKNDRKTKNYIEYVNSLNPESVINIIFKKIPNQSHIFYLVDIFDLESSINLEVLKRIVSKECSLLFIVNKFDVLPKDVEEERMKFWVGEQLKKICSRLPNISQEHKLTYSFVIASSKNGHNFDYLIYKINKIKSLKKSKDTKEKEKVFVIGNTNVGKSTFINQLIHRSDRFHKSSPKIYDGESNMVENLKSLLELSNKAKLTTSILAGTTIGITKIDDIHLGIKVYDTPGIPNNTSVQSLMKTWESIKSITINKKILPHSFNIKQGYSVWIGGIARVDVLSGEDKYFTFFFSSDVTIHKTQLLNCENVFQKQAGILLRPVISENLEGIKLKKTSFLLKCDKFRILNYDIVIPGLGWISISGKGLVDLEVYVPDKITPYLRDKPIMPYEIKSKGVQKYYGNTINSKSKINRKYTMETFKKEEEKKLQRKQRKLGKKSGEKNANEGNYQRTEADEEDDFSDNGMEVEEENESSNSGTNSSIGRNHKL